MTHRLLAAPACALLLIASAIPAAALQSSTVVREGDPQLTCVQMADEAAQLSAEMGEGGGGLLGRVGEVARTGATLLVPGAGLALAGADAVTASGRERKEAEVQTRRDRWNYLNGLYAGRNCNPEQTAEASAVSVIGPEMAPAVAPSPTAPVLATPDPVPTMAAPAISPGGPL